MDERTDNKAMSRVDEPAMSEHPTMGDPTMSEHPMGDTPEEGEHETLGQRIGHLIHRQHDK